MTRMPGWSRLRTLWGRIRRRARRVRLPEGLKRALLIAAACTVVALLTAGGLPVLRRLYVMGWIAGKHYQIAFAALCIVPAAAVHWCAAHSGRRGAAWWTVWLPGIVVYAAFPWRKTVTWEALGIFGPAWDWARTIFLHWNTAPPEVFNNFGAFVAMLAVTIVAFGKLWLSAGKAVARQGPDTAAAPEDVLPSAAWASRSEVVERFSAPGGIVLGELTDPVEESPDFAPDRPRSWGGQGSGQLITMSPTDGNGHVLVTSQASGYKSTGLVIPNILTYDDPIVVFDPKCELYARTKDARRKMGFEPVVIDARNGFDPARLIAALAIEHPSAYHRMAKMVIPQGHSGIENAAYFKAAANNLFSALLAFYAETGSPNILQDVAKVLARPPDGVHGTVERKLGKLKLPFVRNQLGGLKGMDPKFYASVKTEITNQLLFAEMPDVARYITMEEGSKLPRQVIDPKCDIFLNIPQNVAEDFAPMLRVMLGSMLTAAQLIEVNEAPRCRRLFLIDEAAKLGAMDILENIRDRGRSLGLHLMMFYQTPGEIEKLWGRAGMHSWRDGCSATVMGPVSSRTSAADISAMIGTRTLRVRTESTSSSSQVMSPMAGSVSRTDQEQLRDVPLISPTAISQLPRHASVVTSPGSRPILASKAIWFTREDMRDRVRSTKDIKDELAVKGRREALEDRLEKMADAAGNGNAASREPSLSEAAIAARDARTMDDDPSEIRIEEDVVPPWEANGRDRDGGRQPEPDADMAAARTEDPSLREDERNVRSTEGVRKTPAPRHKSEGREPATSDGEGDGAGPPQAEMAAMPATGGEATSPARQTDGGGPEADPAESGQAENATAADDRKGGGGELTKAEGERFMRLVQEEMPLAEIATELGRSVAELEAWSEAQRVRGLLPGSAEKTNDGPP